MSGKRAQPREVFASLQGVQETLSAPEWEVCGWRGWGPCWEVLPGGAAAELQARLSGLHGVVLPSCDPGGQSHLTDGDMESAQRGYQHLGTQWAGPGAGGLSLKSKYDLPCQFMGPGRRVLSPQPLQGFVPQACVFRCLYRAALPPAESLGNPAAPAPCVHWLSSTSASLSCEGGACTVEEGLGAAQPRLCPLLAYL